MHTHILASNPASGWMSQWNAGWHSTPAASGTGSPHDTGLIMLALVVVIILAIYGGLKKIAS
jgi:hypothetical protein